MNLYLTAIFVIVMLWFIFTLQLAALWAEQRRHEQ